MIEVTVAHLGPDTALIHRIDDPPAVTTSRMSAAQAELLGYRWCPDCWGDDDD